MSMYIKKFDWSSGLLSYIFCIRNVMIFLMHSHCATSSLLWAFAKASFFMILPSDSDIFWPRRLARRGIRSESIVAWLSSALESSQWLKSPVQGFVLPLMVPHHGFQKLFTASLNKYEKIQQRNYFHWYAFVSYWEWWWKPCWTFFEFIKLWYNGTRISSYTFFS